MNKIKIFLTTAGCLILGVIVLLTLVPGCSKVNDIKVEAERQIAISNYNDALNTLLEIPDKGLLKNDSLMMLLSTAYYGLTDRPGEPVGVSINDMDFTPDMKQVIFADGTGRNILICSYPDMKRLKQIPLEAYIYGVDVSPDGKQLAAAMSDNVIDIYDLETGTKIKTLTGHTNSVRSVAYQDADHLVSGANDQNVMVWDVPSGKAIASEWIHKKNVKNVRIGNGGQYIVTASNDGSATLLHGKGEKIGKLNQRFSHSENYVNDALLAPDGKSLATAAGDGTIKMWDINDGTMIKTIEINEGIGSIDFSQDAKYMIAGGEKNVYFIDMEKGIVIGKYPVKSNTWAIKFLPDGSYAFTDASYFRYGKLLTGEELIKAAREVMRNA